MPSLPWFRMYAEAIDDAKLKLLAFEDRWHFVAILCLKCAGLLDETFQKRSCNDVCNGCNDDPEVNSLRDRKIGVKLGLGDRDRDEVKRRLMEVGLIDDRWIPIAWDRRQFLSDSSTHRVRAFRQRQIKPGNGDETFQKRRRNGDVTPSDTDTDTEIRDGQTGPFDLFWQAYPKKRKRKPAAEIWRRKHLDPRVDELLADVRRRIETDRRWREGFIPDPTTYLGQERWNDELEAQKRPRVEGL